MARRYRKKYSPDGRWQKDDPSPAPPNPFRGRRATRVDMRALLMFLWPTPLLFGALGALGSGTPLRMALFLLAYASLMFGAWLLREGQLAEIAYQERTLSRPPAFPRKIAAAVMAGAGVGIAGWLAGGGEAAGFAGRLAGGIGFGGLAMGAHLLAFGIDPLRAKGTGDSLASAEFNRVADALDRAGARLGEIERLAHELRDNEIDRRVASLNATARDMITMVEKNPREMDRARRYLNVYLTGAEEATRKFAENRQSLRDTGLRAEYLALLTDLEASFGRGREALLLNDRTELEVEIEVLRERLGQEGA